MLSGRALAFVILAASLLKVLLKHLFGRPRPGIAQFHRNYDHEGLCSLDKDERREIERFTGCVACGRCDVGEAERIIGSNGAYPGVMQLVLASSRSMPDYDAAARGFAFVPDGSLAQKTASCPVRIPFVALKAFVGRKATARIASSTSRQKFGRMLKGDVTAGS